MALKLDLNKSSAALTLSLEKRGILTPPQVDVHILMDVTGSFEDEHESGLTNDLTTRLAPWGLTFDPDKKVDFYTFASGKRSAHYVGPLTEANYATFMRDKVIEKVPGWGGATDYAPVIELMLTHSGWLGSETRAAKPSLLGRMFGAKKEAAPVVERKRSIAFFVTDGENFDKEETRAVLREAQRKNAEVYFMFLGVSNQQGQFAFIRDLADEFDNTGFVPVKDLKAFVNLSDEALNELILCDELMAWLTKK